MAVFVLLAGSWHGGWCWRKVQPGLRAAGHHVLSPTYTGTGERAHLATPDIGLETHIQDVLNVLEYQDVRDAVLVGHSYGGVVMTAVADRAADRVARMIYFDTSIPADGDSVLGLMAGTSRQVVRSRVMDDGWRVLPTMLERLGITDEGDITWAAPRMTPHPLRCFTDPVRLTGASHSIPKAYIACRTPGTTLPERPRQVYAREQGWPAMILPTGHDAMITTPDALVAALLNLAG